MNTPKTGIRPYRQVKNFYRALPPLQDDWWYIVTYDHMPQVKILTFCSPYYHKMIRMLWVQPNYKKLRLAQGWELPDDIPYHSDCVKPRKNIPPEMKGLKARSNVDIHTAELKARRKKILYSVKIVTKVGQYYIIEKLAKKPFKIVRRLKKVGIKTLQIYVGKHKIPKNATVFAGKGVTEKEINQYLENPKAHTGYKRVQALLGSSWSLQYSLQAEGKAAYTCVSSRKRKANNWR